MDALIYAKTVTDKCAILDPGAFLLRRMNLRPGWDDVRIGVFVSFTTAGNPNQTPVSEIIDTTGNPLGLIAYGIKNIVDLDDPASEPLPGQPGSQFLGITNIQNTHSSRIMDGYVVSQGINWINYGYTDGSTIVCDAGIGHLDTTYDNTADTQYCGFWGTRYRRSGNSVTMSRIGYEVALTDVSAAELIHRLRDLPSADDETFVIPFPVGDGFFFRVPFQNNRARIHCYGWYDSTLY